MTKLYSFNDHPEHRQRLDGWRDKWIANAMSTRAMTEADREICREAVIGLYEAAGLPAPKHIVFVPSPFVLRFAGGFAAARWYMHHQNKTLDDDSATRSATDSATRSATDSATASATYSATYSATRSATDSATASATDSATSSATYSATRSATDSATYSATRSATDSATASATYSATYSATRSATDSATASATSSATYSADMSSYWLFRDDARAVADDVGVGAFGIQCAQRAYNMWQGGNQWSAWDSFLTFFRHVAKLPLDYSKYDHWERLSEHSGPRIVHPDFCMISDRPEILMVDDMSRPHCENGPFCRWRDGSAIYAWHGTFVPARWIEDRNSVDPIEVLKAENVEQRAAGLAILGSRMIPALVAQKRGRFIDDSGSPDIGKLFEVDLPGFTTKGRYLVAECPRNGTIMEGVPMVSDIDNLPINTALAAQAWRIGDPVSEYLHPDART